MYWPILTQIKLGFSLTIIVIILFQGCSIQKKSKAPAVPEEPKEVAESAVTASETYHTVQSGETLDGIAKLHGVDYQTVAALNNIPPPYTVHPGQSILISGSNLTEIKINGGTESLPVELPPRAKSQMLEKPVNGDQSGESGEWDYHTVQRGETLYSIAKRYGKTYQQVAAWNNIPSPYRLEVGQRLRVTQRPVTVSQLPVKSARSISKSSTSNPISHVVQRGETLFAIAQRYGYNVKEVANWNGLQPPYQLSSGRRLRVAPLQISTRTTSSRQKASTSTSSRQNNITYHTVARGDTLYSISRQYGSQVADIAQWNDLKPPYTLSVGQSLQIASQNKGKASAPPSQNPISDPNSNQVIHNTGYHTVARGDTLFSISNRYGYQVYEIAAWNNLSPPYDLSVGEHLRVYPPSGIMKAVRRNSKKIPTLSASSSGRTYTVVRGDTLYSIARRYGVGAAQLMLWNNLQQPSKISVGQNLQVSPPASMQRTGGYRGQASSRSHKVKPGETLESIATMYGATAYDLSQWNGIGSPYTIYPGQMLLVTPP